VRWPDGRKETLAMRSVPAPNPSRRLPTNKCELSAWAGGGEEIAVTGFGVFEGE